MTRITKNRRLSGGGKPKIKIGASTTPALVPLKAVVRQARGNMKVVVRIRPVNRNENSNRLVVKPVSESQLVFDPHEEEEGFFFHGVKQNGFRDLNKKQKRNANFAFDNVFSEDSTNLEVFEASIKPLVQTVLDGYNCSVFAYGATGAGKTFTMLGTEACPGIVYLTVTNLWEKMEALKEIRNYEIAVSYLEIYNELVKDLLVPGEPLILREDSSAGVIIQGLSLKKPHSTEELLELLRSGNERRTQHPTDVNKESSRSHAVFQVWLKQRDPKTKSIISLSKLSLIDLAGSERGSATGHSGARFKEGMNINKSLLALGNCISGLAEGKTHIPFRDSKLTRILKDSLGGNCNTVMIAAVSPTSNQFEDTYNTLKYADRAKKIKLVKKLLSPADIKISKLEEEVASLRAANEELTLRIKKFESGEVNPTKMVPKEEKEVITKEDIETCKKSLTHLSEARVNARLNILKIQSLEKEINYRMQSRQKLMKRCMKFTVNTQLGNVAKRSEKLESMRVRKIEGLEVRMEDAKKRLISIESSLQKYEQKMNTKFGEEWPEEIKLFAKLLKVECRLAEFHEKVKHLEKLLKLREQLGAEDHEHILNALEMTQTYYLLLRTEGHVSQYQEAKFEEFMHLFEKDQGIIWEADCNNDSETVRLSVEKPQIPANVFLQEVEKKNETLDVKPVLNELEDTNMSSIPSPIPVRFAAVNDSISIRNAPRVNFPRDEPFQNDNYEATGSGDHQFGISSKYSPVKGESIVDDATYAILPKITIEECPEAKDLANATFSMESRDEETKVIIKSGEVKGVVNLTPPMEDLNVDTDPLNETITISVSNDGPVGSNPDVDNSVVSLLSSKKSIPFPVRPSSTLFKKADKENIFRVPTSKTVKTKDNIIQPNRGLRRVPSISQSTIDLRSPLASSSNLRKEGTPSNLWQRGRSASTSNLAKKN
ncbi:kinesin-like protein KIF18A isoform X2 [Artemia franciscana]|uniref:kinesin-like protein KIF18A isoform X2 n=1 Tax=Artemia franciscana TaxID=6661 RepID=UPI0032DAD950